MGDSENPAKFDPNRLIVVNPDVGLFLGDTWLREGAR
jgi:hypothetical protein